VDTLWQLYLVQVGIGAATAASLYEAAMAVIVSWSPPARRSAAILAVTIVAGFASTIFLPLSGWLTGHVGWRHALLVLAAVQALTVPLHALVIRRPPRRPAPPGVTPQSFSPDDRGATVPWKAPFPARKGHGGRGLLAARTIRGRYGRPIQAECP
jgi:MFS family permease